MTEMRLFRTRQELVRHLVRREVPSQHRLRYGAGMRHVPAWMAEFLRLRAERDARMKLDKPGFLRLLERVPETLRAGLDHEETWYALMGGSLSDSGRLSVERVTNALAQDHVVRDLRLIAAEDYGTNGPVLSTIHGSKGLEADKVVLFLHNQHGDLRAAQKSEEARVLYVAVTRCRREFVVRDDRLRKRAAFLVGGRDERIRGGSSRAGTRYGGTWVEFGRRNGYWKDLTFADGSSFTASQEALRRHPGTPVPCRLNREGWVVARGTPIGRISSHYWRDSEIIAEYRKGNGRSDEHVKALEGLLWYGCESRAFPAGSLPSGVTGAHRDSRAYLEPLVYGLGRVNWKKKRRKGRK